MKNIIILRHAKSDWSDSTLDDFDRPLNKRGKKAAPLMGKILALSQVPVNLVLSSPANRAKNTALLALEELDYDVPVKWVEDFYHGDTSSFLDTIKELDDSIETIMVVGHNPGLENLIEDLVSAGSLQIKLPTAGLVFIECSSPTWTMIDQSYCELKWFLIPRLIKKILKG